MCTLSILHIRNIANVAYNLAIEQRKLGHEVCTMEILYNPLIYRSDINLQLSRKYPKKDLPKRFWKISKTLVRMMIKNKYDIIHLHAAGIYPLDIDIPIFFRCFGNVVVHWHGTKLRTKGRSFGSRFSDIELVSTPDLLGFAPDAVWVANPVTKHGLTKIERNDNKIIIGHAPTNRLWKGTEHFLRAMKSIKRYYQNVEMLLIENVPYQQALEMYQLCDIMVDAVELGWYGVLTSEVQAMGIPVCEKLIANTKYLPEASGIVNVTKDSLEKKLRVLIEDEELRNRLGQEGKMYVEKYHNNETINKRIMELYKKTMTQ